MAKKPKQKKRQPPKLKQAIRAKLPRRLPLIPHADGRKTLEKLIEAEGVRRRKKILKEFNKPKNIPKRKRQSI